MRIFGAILAVSALIACGGETGDDSSSGTGGSSTGGSGGTTGGTGGTSGTGGSTTTGCPANEPIGAPCDKAQEGKRCTYGDSVRPECHHDWTCSNGSWLTTKSVCLPDGASCLPTAPTDPKVTCPTDGDVCGYADGTICICSSCIGACAPPPPWWQCSPPPTGPGCPQFVPNDGSPCSSEGATCTYGNPCSQSGAQVVCKSGAWYWDPLIACPA